MDLVGISQEKLLDFLARAGFAQWLKITTSNPLCTYYFGPFITEKEAKIAQAGYLEDLLQEGAEVTGVEILQCHPGKLTISEDEFAGISHHSSSELISNSD